MVGAVVFLDVLMHFPSFADSIVRGTPEISVVPRGRPQIKPGVSPGQCTGHLMYDDTEDGAPHAAWLPVALRGAFPNDFHSPLDCIAIFSDHAAMPYPGGKHGAGVFQTIISRMPPHSVYIEPFLGGGAIMRMKRPAAVNIGLDLDPEVIRRFQTAVQNDPEASPAATMADPIADNVDGRRLRRSAALHLVVSPGVVVCDRGAGITGDSGGAAAPGFLFKCVDALGFLRRYRFTGGELVYCDPPYMHETRGRSHLYRFEMSDRQHGALLALLRRLPCFVMLSGYWTRRYVDALADWHLVTFQTVNRAGRRTTELLWSNFPEPFALHDYRYLGKTFRERERIKRKQKRWVGRLHSMPLLERRALLHAISDAWGLTGGGILSA